MKKREYLKHVNDYRIKIYSSHSYYKKKKIYTYSKKITRTFFYSLYRIDLTKFRLKS